MLSSAGASWRTNLPINDTLSKREKKDVFQIYHWGKAEARAVHGCGSSFVPLAGGGLLNCFDYPSGAVGKGIQAGDVNEVREKLKRSGPPGALGRTCLGVEDHNDIDVRESHRAQHLSFLFFLLWCCTLGIGFVSTASHNRHLPNDS